eukprot:g26245.t1
MRSPIPNSSTSTMFAPRMDRSTPEHPRCPPISRDRCLRDSLICSTLPTNYTTASTFPCNRRKCYTCPYTYPYTSIKSQNKLRCITMLGNIISEASDDAMLLYAAWNLYCLVCY